MLQPNCRLILNGGLCVWSRLSLWMSECVFVVCVSVCECLGLSGCVWCVFWCVFGVCVCCAFVGVCFECFVFFCISVLMSCCVWIASVLFAASHFPKQLLSHPLYVLQEYIKKTLKTFRRKLSCQLQNVCLITSKHLSYIHGWRAVCFTIYC